MAQGDPRPRLGRQRRPSGNPGLAPAALASLLVHAALASALALAQRGAASRPDARSSAALVELVEPRTGGAAAGLGTRVRGAEAGARSGAARVRPRRPRRRQRERNRLWPASAALPPTAVRPEPLGAAGSVRATTAGSSAVEAAGPAQIGSSAGRAGAGASRGSTAAGPGRRGGAGSGTSEPAWGELRGAVGRYVVYPGIGRRRGWQGKVVVGFGLLEDGHVVGLRVLRSSGFAALDESAVAAVERAIPLPPLGRRAEIVLPIVFALR